MGLNKKNYYTTKDIASTESLYNIILSGRGVGKSYAIQAEKDKNNPYYEGYLHRAYRDKKPVVAYLRRRLEDIKPSLVIADFNDKNISAITKGEFNTVDCYRGALYFANLNDDGKIIRASFPFGYTFALVLLERYKSRQYPDITDIVFEEFVTNNLYLRDEPNQLQQFVSTIFRDRIGRVWMLANTISRVCPYWQEWNLRNIPQMKEGQIDIYNLEGVNNSTTQIAVELSPNRNNNTSMFFGNVAKSIVGSSWESKTYLHLYDMKEDSTLKDFDILELVTLKYNGFIFNCRLLMDENGTLFVYINPARKEADYIITDEPSLQPNISPHFNRMSRTHNKIVELLNDKKVCFSTNLCGEDFYNCINNAKIHPF